MKSSSSINNPVASESPSFRVWSQSRFLLTARSHSTGTPSSAHCCLWCCISCHLQQYQHHCLWAMKFIQMILIQREKMKSFFSWPSYFQPSGFPQGQGRGGTALLLSWEWMAGSGQKLIKLALAEDMNCGITPWIASNPISLAQLVMRSWDEFQPARKHSSWTFTRKSIHWTLRFLLKFLLDFYTWLNLPHSSVCPNFSIWISLTEQFCHLKMSNVQETIKASTAGI